MRETWVLFLGWEDSLEKGKATLSSILAWRSPCGCKELDTAEWLSLSLHFKMQKLKLASFLVIILIGGEHPQFKLESIYICKWYSYENMLTCNSWIYSLLKMKCDGSYILGVSHKKTTKLIPTSPSPRNTPPFSLYRCLLT